MKVLLSVALLLISQVALSAELTCELKSLSTGATLEVVRTDGGIMIARHLGPNRYLLGHYETRSATVPGYFIAIYDSSTNSEVSGSFGHEAGEAFSIKDESLDLVVNCMAN